jgi:hypothetical protein
MNCYFCNKNINMKTKDSFAILRKILFLILALAVISACKKDDNNDDNNPSAPVNPIVGTYTFIASTFNDPITVIAINGDTNHYIAGDDASLFVGGGLLGSAPCDNADNAALDLRANFTSFYVCLGESNEAQQGTWSIESETVLQLNISNPANFVVRITNLDLTDSKLTGNIPSLPMPYDASIPVGDTLPGGGINFQIANVTVEFLKVE